MDLRAINVASKQSLFAFRRNCFDEARQPISFSVEFPERQAEASAVTRKPEFQISFKIMCDQFLLTEVHFLCVFLHDAG